MAWTLQPRSYYQAMRPNWYSVAYLRTGAYKGMGSLGQASGDGVSIDQLTNLPLVGPYTSNPLVTSAYFSPSPSGTVSVDASKYLPWLLAGFFFVLLAAKR